VAGALKTRSLRFKDTADGMRPGYKVPKIPDEE
jgi:hypothetical protein